MTGPRTMGIHNIYMILKQIFRSRPCLSATVFLIVCQFIFTGCAGMNKTSKLKLTPVTDIPTNVHHQGKFVWNDLLTDDIDAAKTFYGQLFGWHFVQMDGYTVVKNKGQRIGGMVQIGETSRVTGSARWLSVLSVDDVDGATSLVSREGGIVHEGPLDMLNRGRGAIVSDPQGAQLLLLHASGGDPADMEAPMGSWLWHELWSNDAEAALSFYQKLVGYDVDDENIDYLILIKDGQWRAGIRSLPERKGLIRWVPVVRVADTDAVVMRAADLGGKILVKSRPTPGGGSVGLLADPSDALVIIQRLGANPVVQEN